MYKDIDYLIKRKACLGCGLCLKTGEMVLASDGYYYPGKDAIIDASFKEYCPGYGIAQNRRNKSKEELIYGSLSDSIMVGSATNANVNFKASSGGIITSLLLYLLRNKLVDSILQVRESPDNPMLSEPHLSTTEEEVLACMGSRYAPCSLFEHINQNIEVGGRMAVVGKPCDIAALKAYMKLYPSKTKDIKYTFSVMCMGLPSQNATKELLHYLDVKENNLLSLRYRGYGWPGLATAETKDGVLKTCSYIQSWGAILGRDTLFRCKLCPNGFGEFADITCGDAWYCKNGQPDFEKKEKGRSLIFARTERGKNILECAVSEGFIIKEPYSTKSLSSIQKSQYERKTNLLGRYVIYKLLVNPHFQLKGFRLFRLAHIAGLRSLLSDARGFVGRWWRSYKGHYKVSENN